MTEAAPRAAWAPRHAVLVVNPAAHGGAVLRLRGRVLDALHATGWRVSEVITTSADDATRIAREADSDDVLVSLGGDGLLGRLAEGAMSSGASVTPLPGGRGNDFVRSLGLPSDPVEVAAALPTARERRVDVGLVDGRAFLGVASVGYDTTANTLANEIRFVRGAAVYTVSGLRTFVTDRPHEFEVVTEEGSIRGRLWNVAVGNSGRYGGGLKVCPDASLDDGRLDLLTVDGRLGRLAFARVLLGMYSGAHVRREGVDSRLVRHVEIRSDEPLVIFADGDPIGTTPARIEIRPGALRLLA